MIDYSNEWMSLLRFAILSAMFLINLASLIRLMIFNVKSDKKNDRHCVHTVTNSVIVLINMFYLLTWLPYLGLSLYDSNYLSTNSIEQCILQYLLSSIMTTVLLSVLVIRKIYCCFNCENAKIISFALILAWIAPQIVYLTIMEIYGDKLSPFEQSNKLIVPMKSYFGSEFIDLDTNQTSSNLFETNDFNLTSGTFLICVHRLSSQIVSQLSWHYVVLVIPLTAIVFLSFIGQALNKSFYSFNDKHINKNCDCKDDLLVSTCLYLNLLWLLVLRPLIVLQTLVLKRSRTVKQQTYLDFGTHFILICSVCLFPFSYQGGFRTLKFRKTTNCNQTNKVPLIRKQHQQGDLSPNNTPDLSSNTIFALHPQYLMNYQNQNDLLANSNNLFNSNAEDESSGYHAFNNLGHFYRY